MIAALIAAAALNAAVLNTASLTMPDMPLHDPFIVADKKTRTYYLYTSNNPRMSGACGLGTMAYESHDLEHWTAPRLVFALPKGTWARGGAWAPEAHAWRGKYYLFTTFHNEAALITDPAPKPHRQPYRRGAVLAVADRPEGPFHLVNNGEPIAPANRMTLDGALYIDPDGRPWLVYAHEWVQQTDGTIEALPLDDDLKAAGEPVTLFSASDAKWVHGSRKGPDDTVYVTDGPELYRTKDGHLLMLWSSYGDGGYIEAQARSTTGRIEGPWAQLGPLVTDDSGHGMLFHAFDGRLMLVLHHPFDNARGRLFEMRDAGDHLEVVRERADLDHDGDARQPLPPPPACAQR